MAKLPVNTKKVQTFIPSEIKDEFKALCERNGYTMSSALKAYLYRALKENEL